MSYLRILKDEDVFPTPEFETPGEYIKRVTVKAIVRNARGEFAFVTNEEHGLVTLAGGGAQSDDLHEEIRRECVEEINCEVSIMREVGKTQEFRNKNARHYETTCFLAEVLEEVSGDFRTDKERESGLSAVWLTPEEAFATLARQVEHVRKGSVGYYNTSFDIMRDHAFFHEFLKKELGIGL